MINIDEYLEIFTEDEHEISDREYQEKLFLKYTKQGAKTTFETERLSLLQDFEEGEPLTGKDGLRKKLAAIDLGYFAQSYFPHYFSRPAPEFHAELDRIFQEGVIKGLNPLASPEEINKQQGCRRVTAAPRGHAKSTNFTFKDSIHAALYGYKHYILILSDSSDQAEGFLSDIKTELEENTQIIEDFGKLEGKIWKGNVILTTGNVKIEAIGSGKKIRGRRHRNWRPDLIILDDVENDENVNTPEQRRKLANWFYKAVSKAGDTYTDIVYIGTVLHYDSLLSKVLSNPSYKAVKYQGIISYAKNSYLWDEWEKIYTNLSDSAHEDAALKFFERNKVDMLEGTEVLWEEKLSYYDLMVIRVSEGVASFNSEIQNEPIDPDSCVFNEEWLDLYSDGDYDFSAPQYICLGAVDPSLGKNKKSDTSAILVAFKDTKTGYVYVEIASIERRKPDSIIDDSIEISKRFRRDYKKRLYKFGVETVQFQYYFKDIMARISAERGEYLPIEEINSLQNKEARIVSLQPFIKNGYIKINERNKELIRQLTEYPMGKNDDGPDCLQMVWKLSTEVNGSNAQEYKSVISRALRFKRGAY